MAVRLKTTQENTLSCSLKTILLEHFSQTEKVRWEAIGGRGKHKKIIIMNQTNPIQ